MLLAGMTSNLARQKRRIGRGKIVNTITHAHRARLAAVSIAALVCGCAAIHHTSSAPPGAIAQAAPTPIPLIQNCAVVNIGSPSKFACNGKVYTTFELAKIREQAAKNAATETAMH